MKVKVMHCQGHNWKQSDRSNLNVAFAFCNDAGCIFPFLIGSNYFPTSSTYTLTGQKDKKRKRQKKPEKARKDRKDRKDKRPNQKYNKKLLNWIVR